MDPFFPPEWLSEVFLCLEPMEAATLKSVCRRWNDLLSASTWWEDQYRFYFGGDRDNEFFWRDESFETQPSWEQYFKVRHASYLKIFRRSPGEDMNLLALEPSSWFDSAQSKVWQFFLVGGS